MFDGPEDYHARIDDPKLEIDEHCILFIRGTGPIGYPGGAEVVNMQPPARSDQEGRHAPFPASATAGSRAPRARPRSSTPRPRRRPAAGSRCCAPATASASISSRRTRQYPHLRRGAGDPPRRAGEARLRLSREPDALAADPARDGRPVRRGHGAEAGGRLPAPRADDGRAAGQSLSRDGERAGRQAARWGMRMNRFGAGVFADQPIGPPVDPRPAKRPERDDLGGTRM